LTKYSETLQECIPVESGYDGRYMRRLFHAVILALLVSVIPTDVRAQTTGTVTGTATDETGGVLPGVSVSLLSTGTRRTVETVTSDVGVYRFENVPPAPAEITFRLINFSTVRRDIAVSGDGTVTADALMLVAASADIVITAP